MLQRVAPQKAKPVKLFEDYVSSTTDSTPLTSAKPQVCADVWLLVTHGISSLQFLLKDCLRGLNSSVGSVLGSLSCLMQRHGFDPPLRRIFPVERIIPLELTWVLTPFPQNSFG